MSGLMNPLAPTNPAKYATTLDIDFRFSGVNTDFKL
jgi:hypothetical protein